MMDYPLTIRSIYERARTLFPEKQIVSRRAGGAVARTTYGEWAERVARLAGGLRELGVGQGDRVATFCWNHDRHLETYFGAALMGASYHTLNIRLAPDQLAYIVNHARDKVLVIDASLTRAVAPILGQLDSVEHVVVIEDGGEAPGLDAGAVHDYEAMVEGATPVTDWPRLDEQATAGICYTSATTGNPKGVAYSHRALFLHTLMIGSVGTAAIAERDVLLPIVPMFHVNAWGMPFAAAWYGAGQVFGGPAPTPADYIRLIREEGVTVSAGVPTVWLGVLQILEQEGGDLSPLQRIMCGGSAAPVSMIRAYEERYGVEFIHAYGMTEASPVTHFSRLKTSLEGLPVEARYSYKAKQGMLVPGLEQRIVDSAGNEVPADGKSMGELLLRGPWIASEYLDDERSAETFVDGWYHTGDVATLDGEGYLHLVDRTKDLVKSGGEWISSVELENALMGQPDVAEAAVIAVPDQKWGERPLAVVVRKSGSTASEAELAASIADKFPKWWLPDRFEFVDEIPKTATGKFSKRTLREHFAGGLVDDDTDER
ncbi:MAG TPA: long-chain fatty acid--CoA ligase [Actinomycetota bacterium]|jgi:fatty-acyl-CoA synthase|nr:long-chain fatty acid--CoA ligase [Actinomycetota bacterium]